MSFNYKILINLKQKKKRSILIKMLITNYWKEQITNGLAIDLECDYCHAPVLSKPRVLKFADLEHFFCCNSCKRDYSEKYKGRIESIKRRYEGKSETES